MQVKTNSNPSKPSPHAERVAKRVAMEYVDPYMLAREAADRWTTENLGMSWPESTWTDAACEIDNVGLEEEYRHWHKLALDCIHYVTAKGLPMSLASMEVAFKDPSGVRAAKRKAKAAAARRPSVIARLRASGRKKVARSGRKAGGR